MERLYEEYSEDKKKRFSVYDKGNYVSVVTERYFEEFATEGYVEPAGFREVRDGMVHTAGTLEEGIEVGRELLRNM